MPIFSSSSSSPSPSRRDNLQTRVRNKVRNGNNQAQASHQPQQWTNNPHQNVTLQPAFLSPAPVAYSAPAPGLAPGWAASPPAQANYGLHNVKWASTSNIHQTRPQPNLNLQSCISLPSNLCGAAISVTNLADTALPDNTRGYLHQGAALFNAVSQKFDDVISCIDEELFSGTERDLGE
jgi:hypothetical protein